MGNCTGLCAGAPTDNKQTEASEANNGKTQIVSVEQVQKEYTKSLTLGKLKSPE